MRSWTYGYDLLDRITSAAKAGLTQSWTYDANGNRLSEGGSESTTYAVDPTSNRLTGATGALLRAYAYEPSGQVSGDGTHTFSYNDAGRLVAVTGPVNAAYLYNALGQRIRKTVDGVTTYFLYDEAGRLIGEYDGTGALIQEIVWLEDTPVATLRDCSCGDAIFYIHTDHLNTPRKITKRSVTDVVWRWDSDPFGTTAANEDPDGDSTLFVYNLRFPGQYYDEETGLHYNYHRDYDPVTGRYVQSDPIGLGDGSNTFAYTGNRPTVGVDPLGLFTLIPVVSWGMADSIPGGRFKPGGTNPYARTKCTCTPCGSVWVLTECLTFHHIEVLIRPDLKPGWERKVRRWEAEHVSDLRDGFDSMYEAGTAAETAMQRLLFSSEYECQERSQLAVGKAVMAALKPFYDRSKRRDRWSHKIPWHVWPFR